MPEQLLDTLLGDEAAALCAAADIATPLRALVKLLEEESPLPALAHASLERVVMAYLSTRRRGHLLDPVAGFHLANGARIERINIAGDHSRQGLDASYGVMVNYVYDLEQVEANHENFVNSGAIAASRSLSRILREVERVRETIGARRVPP